MTVVHFRGNTCVIQGTAYGVIRWNGLVHIKSQAVCRADIIARYLKVSGEVYGRVNVDYLVIDPQGKLLNKAVSYKKIIMHADSSIDDHSRSFNENNESRLSSLPLKAPIIHGQAEEDICREVDHGDFEVRPAPGKNEKSDRKIVFKSSF